MSTRLYPLYQRGNPQLRVFLPNFWMKLVPPSRATPPNVVKFMVSPQMTKYDVHQYLSKIYNVHAVQVNVAEYIGKFRRVPRKGYIVKDDDYKMAYVSLPFDEHFKYPDVMDKSRTEVEEEADMKLLKQMRVSYEDQKAKYVQRPGVPSWFN